MRVVRWLAMAVFSALAAVGVGYLLGLLRPRLHPMEAPAWTVHDDVTDEVTDPWGEGP